MPLRTNRRAGLTLVELIVVIAIIATLATITALYFPRFQEQEQVNRGADMLQGWLLIARQQARRDGVPTGIRFTFDSTTRICQQMNYVQQPANFAQGLYLGRFNNDPRTALIKYVNLTIDGTKVEDGDYIEFLGLIRRVSTPTLQDPSIPQSTLPIAAGPDVSTDVVPDAGATSPPNYRIIPQPRPIAGEQALQLPDNIGIDQNSSQNLPSRTANGTQIIEVIFSPSGALTGEGSTSRQVIFWVKHLSTNIDRKTLITVQPRTGFIAAHPVASGSDPYQFTRDARSSGM